MKFPHKVWGSLASSAPVRWFKDLTDPGSYVQKASEVLLSTYRGNTTCKQAIGDGFVDLNRLWYD
jgi:hypothetical protein